MSVIVIPGYFAHQGVKFQDGVAAVLKKIEIANRDVLRPSTEDTVGGRRQARRDIQPTFP